MIKKSAYIIATTVIVLAIVVFLNLIVAQLPSHIREIDLTDNSLYSISDLSVNFLNGLTHEVSLSVIAEEKSMDKRISRFLDKYASLSKRISLKTIDPVAHPSILNEYKTQANTIVVVCEETGKQRIIPFTDMIQSEYDMMSYYLGGGGTESQFDAEGQLTTAIDYVTKENSEKIYAMTGHNEPSLSQTAANAIAKMNLNYGSVNLLKDGAVPADCSVLLSFAPSRDLANDELQMASDWIANGGHMLIVLSESEDSLPNFESLMSDYGMKVAKGYIADSERYYRQFNSMFAIFPSLSDSHAVTSAFTPDDLSLLINARGLTTVDPQRKGATVKPFLTTSANAYAKTNDEEIKGQYILGAVATDAEKQGMLTVFTSPSLISDQLLSSFSNLINLQIFMNALTSGMKDVSAISIPAKSLKATYNTFTNPGVYSSFFSVILPILILGGGFIYWINRRKK